MKTFLKYIYPTIIPVVLFALIGWFLWQWNMNRINKDLQDKVSTIIKKSINQQLETNPFLPDVVLINVDSVQNKQLTDSLKQKITSFLTNYYLNKNKKIDFDNLDFEPFFFFPQKPSNNGEYLLTSDQIEALNGHIKYLAKKVELEVNRTKEEVGRDIDRLNTWVTIWIGFIGLIGIFIPIILQIDVSKNASEALKRANVAEEKSTEAKNKATDAISLLKSKEESINKIENIEQKVQHIETISNNASTEADKAKKDSEAALKETKEIKSNLALIIAINSLKEYNPKVLIHIANENRIPFLKRILEKILNVLQENGIHYNNPMLKNWLRQFSENIQSISLFKFIDRNITRELNDFAILIEDSLDDFNNDKYKNIIRSLEELITEIEQQIADT